MPLTGMPTLSTMVAISCGGMIWRIAFWMAANWLARLLDPRADRRAGMHQDLAGIDRREEVAAEERRQQRTTPARRP